MNTENILRYAGYFTLLDMKIIDLVSEGMNTDDIARSLRMSGKAVERHIKTIGGIILEVCYSV